MILTLVLFSRNRRVRRTDPVLDLLCACFIRHGACDPRRPNQLVLCAVVRRARIFLCHSQGPARHYIGDHRRRCRCGRRSERRGHRCDLLAPAWSMAKIPGRRERGILVSLIDSCQRHILLTSLVRNRRYGFWSCLINAAFSYAGVESVAMAAAETKSPRQNIRKAAKRVFFRVFFLYILSLFIVTLIVP